MARKTWILDTETKGTGARVVPLERALERSSSSSNRVTAMRRPRPRREPEVTEPAPRSPRSFKVVDVMTREVLTEGADAAETLEVLRGVRSVVDAHVYVWETEQAEWRALTLAEQRSLMGLRPSTEPTGPGQQSS